MRKITYQNGKKSKYEGSRLIVGTWTIDSIVNNHKKDRLPEIGQTHVN